MNQLDQFKSIAVIPTGLFSIVFILWLYDLLVLTTNIADLLDLLLIERIGKTQANFYEYSTDEDYMLFVGLMYKYKSILI